MKQKEFGSTGEKKISDKDFVKSLMENPEQALDRGHSTNHMEVLEAMWMGLLENFHFRTAACKLKELIYDVGYIIAKMKNWQKHFLLDLQNNINHGSSITPNRSSRNIILAARIERQPVQFLGGIPRT